MTQQEFVFNSTVLLGKLKDSGIDIQEPPLTSFPMDITYLAHYGTVPLQISIYRLADMVSVIGIPQTKICSVYQIGKAKDGAIIEWMGFDVAKFLQSPF